MPYRELCNIRSRPENTADICYNARKCMLWYVLRSVSTSMKFDQCLHYLSGNLDSWLSRMANEDCSHSANADGDQSSLDANVKRYIFLCCDSHAVCHWSSLYCMHLPTSPDLVTKKKKKKKYKHPDHTACILKLV